jgi:hypothetical protein
MKICKACGGELGTFSTVCNYCDLDLSEESSTFSDYDGFLRSLSKTLAETAGRSDALEKDENISRIVESLTLPESNDNLIKFSLFLVSQAKSVAGQIRSGNIGRAQELSAWLSKVDQCKNVLVLKDDSFKKRHDLLQMLTEVEALSKVTGQVFKVSIAMVLGFAAVLVIILLVE